MSHTKRSDYARREENAFGPIELVLIFVLPAVLILAGAAVVIIAVFSRTVGRPACAGRLTRAIGGRGSVSPETEVPQPVDVATAAAPSCFLGWWPPLTLGAPLIASALLMMVRDDHRSLYELPGGTVVMTGGYQRFT